MEQAKRNILVGKIGKTVKFTNNKIETGGGNDVLFISTVARMHPEWMLWIVGPNELYKIEGTQAYEDMFPAHNCKSLFACDKDAWEGRYNPILENIKKECSNAITYISGDFNLNTNIDELVKDVDIVYHLISTSIPATSNLAIEKDLKENVIMTTRLLDACVRQDVKKIVFISSGGAVYGKEDKMPLKEDDPSKPISSYGIQKITIEKLLYLYDYSINTISQFLYYHTYPKM